MQHTHACSHACPLDIAGLLGHRDQNRRNAENCSMHGTVRRETMHASIVAALLARARDSTGRADVEGRLPELWSRRSTALGRVLKCVISDCDLSRCPDYAASLRSSCALRSPRRYHRETAAHSGTSPMIGDLSLSLSLFLNIAPRIEPGPVSLRDMTLLLESMLLNARAT